MSEVDQERARAFAEARLRNVKRTWLKDNRADYRWSAAMSSSLNHLADVLLVAGARENISDDDYCERLSKLRTLLWEINYVTFPALESSDRRAKGLTPEELKALNSRRENYMWEHPNLNDLFRFGYASPAWVSFDEKSFEQIVAKYLLDSSLHTDLIEWTMLDSLMCNEVINFGEAIKLNLLAHSHGHRRASELYHRENGNVDDIKVATDTLRLKRTGLWLAAFVGAPIVLIATKTAPLPAIGGCIGLAGALHLMYLTVNTQIRRMRGTHQFAPDKTTALWGQMLRAADSLRGPVINPTVSRELIMAARDQGAVWAPSIYTLIDRAVRRNVDTWVVSMESF